MVRCQEDEVVNGYDGLARSSGLCNKALADLDFECIFVVGECSTVLNRSSLLRLESISSDTCIWASCY